MISSNFGMNVHHDRVSCLEDLHNEISNINSSKVIFFVIKTPTNVEETGKFHKNIVKRLLTTAVKSQVLKAQMGVLFGDAFMNRVVRFVKAHKQLLILQGVMKLLGFALSQISAKSSQIDEGKEYGVLLGLHQTIRVKNLNYTFKVGKLCSNTI